MTKRMKEESSEFGKTKSSVLLFPNWGNWLCTHWTGSVGRRGQSLCAPPAAASICLPPLPARRHTDKAAGFKGRQTETPSRGWWENGFILVLFIWNVWKSLIIWVQTSRWWNSEMANAHESLTKWEDTRGGGTEWQRHCEDLAWHACATCTKPVGIDCLSAHGVKDGSLHSFGSSILHLLEVLISQIVHVCLVRLWGCSAPLASLRWQYWLRHNWETHNGDLQGESWKQACESR